MKMKNRILILILLNLLTFSYANECIDMQSFRKCKISFYCNDNITEVQKNIQENLNFLSSQKENLSEELYLTLENNLIIEKINFTPETNESKKEIYLLINNQSVKNDLFIKDKNIKKLSNEYLVSIADLKTRMLNFLTSTKMYSESMAIKDLYLTALKNNKKFSNALLGYGLWLYFAPPIVGGGHQESLKKIIEAEKNAVFDEDLYFILLYKSQLLFVMNRMDEYKKTLEKAHNLIPSEVFIKDIEEINEKGTVFFD